MSPPKQILFFKRTIVLYKIVLCFNGLIPELKKKLMRNIPAFNGMIFNKTMYSNRLFILLFILVTQSGCLNNPLRSESRPLPSINTNIDKATVIARPSISSDSEVETKKVIEIKHGNEEYLGKERDHSVQKLVSGDKGVSLSFKNIELSAFIQAIMGDALHLNYVVDPSVSGMVTIQTVSPFPNEDLLGVLEEVLALNGATILLNQGLYKVLPLNKAAQLPLVSRVKRMHNQGYGLQIVPLKYIGASEMAQILKPTAKNQAVVYIDKRRNLLMLSGGEALLTSMIDLITIFDVDWLAGKSVSLFPLRYVEPAVLVKELETALNGQRGELFDGIVRLIPIERVNGILVVSSTKEYMLELANWIERLDIANDKTENRLYVYPLQNTKAIDIATILNNIFGNSKKTGFNQQKTAQIMPSDKPVVLRDARRDANTPVAANQVAISSNRNGIGIPQQSNVRIIADEMSNTLVIMGSSRDYEMVESAIRKLDILPKQVLIEASIIEVSLTGDLSVGVEWFFKNGGIDSNKAGRGTLSLGNDGLANISPGFSYNIVDNLGDVRMVLNALESETNVQVLSSPSIMVLDNSSASINVGDEIPVPTSQSTSNDSTALTVNSIEYRNTGISLEVSPRINAGGLVTLEVIQEVSDAVSTTTSGIDAPTIQQRSINSTVAIQSGQSVILGGLIKNKREDITSGVPILSRFPLLGGLFSQTNNSDRRTELLVILTPHVIANSSQARAITDEYREKLIQPLDLEH